MKTMIAICVILTFMLSCTEEKKEYQELKVNNDVLLVNDIPMFNMFEECDTTYAVNATYNQKIEMPLTIVKGYSRIKVRKSYPKMKFYKADAEKIGVDPNKIYSVQYLTIENDVDRKGKSFFSYDSPRCGGTPILSDTGEEISNFDRRGYRTTLNVNSDISILSTHLVYVDCTYPQGTPVKKYYPCHPAVLEWIYILY